MEGADGVGLNWKKLEEVTFYNWWELKWDGAGCLKSHQRGQVLNYPPVVICRIVEG